MPFTKDRRADARAFWTLLGPAILLLVTAGALIALAMLKTQYYSVKIFLLVLSACIVTFAVVMIVLWRQVTGRSAAFLKKSGVPDPGVHHNIFLYNQEKDVDVSADELTVDDVVKRMTVILTFFAKRKKLNIEAVLDTSPRSKVPAVMRPLFVWVLLYNIAGADNELQWSSFLSCGKPMADAVAAVMAGEDEDLVRRLQRGVALYTEQKKYDAFRTYMVEHRDAIGERMLQYVREHIREFD